MLGLDFEPEDDDDDDEEKDDDRTSAASAGVGNFINKTKDRGIGAMELIAIHLKQQGALLCRTLSFSGVEFDIVEATLTDEMRATYDRAAARRQMLHVKIEHELDVEQAAYDEDDEADAKRVRKKMQVWRGVFWGAHQRFFKSLIMGFKADARARAPRARRLARAAIGAATASSSACRARARRTRRARPRGARRRARAAAAAAAGGGGGGEDDEDARAGVDVGEDMLSAPLATTLEALINNMARVARARGQDGQRGRLDVGACGTGGAERAGDGKRRRRRRRRRTTTTTTSC